MPSKHTQTVISTKEDKLLKTINPNEPITKTKVIVKLAPHSDRNKQRRQILDSVTQWVLQEERIEKEKQETEKQEIESKSQADEIIQQFCQESKLFKKPLPP